MGKRKGSKERTAPEQAPAPRPVPRSLPWDARPFYVCLGLIGGIVVYAVATGQASSPLDSGGAASPLAALVPDDGKDRTKGGQPGAWSSEERSEAEGLCRKYASAYGVSSCRIGSFCRCAVVNYEGRAPFREFRDSLAPAVAAYIRPGAYGYFCTSRAASACGEEE